MASLPANRAAAFVEYARGTNLEDISLALAIPLTSLKRWAHDEGWAALVPSVPTVPAVVPKDVAKRAQERIQANREKNLAIAQRLQEDLLEVVDKLRRDELVLERVFANGTRTTVKPGLRDRNDLALYARNVAEMSYRALGDVLVDSTKAGTPEAGTGGAGQITIVLPPIVAQPRQVRDAEAVIEVVPAQLTSGAALTPAQPVEQVSNEQSDGATQVP